jgi:hypothetical protein
VYWPPISSEYFFMKAVRFIGFIFRKSKVE